MKLFDTSLTPDEQELSWYVDRKVVLEDLEQRLKWEANTISNVIVFHGPGGIGKTSVRKMVESLLLKPSEIPYAVVDYEPESSQRSAERTFAQIRRQLGRYSLKFTAFDLVWARYWEETTQQRISNTKIPPELEDAVGVLAIIPILGDAAQSIISLAKLSQSASQWFEERFGKANVTRLQQMNALDLVKLMPEAMAHDLEKMVEDKRNRGNGEDGRITVIFDGFERLEEHGIDDWFIRDFCQASGSTLKVIFGREALRWDRYQPLWQKHVIHHPALANLDAEDALEYLKKRGIQDPDLSQYITELTDGFPYHLRLAADLCQQIQEATERAPSVADFAEIESNSSIGEALLSSLLRQLDKSDYDAAILASIPRWFNQEIIELLVAEPASTPRLFEMLIRFSFCDMIPERPGSYIMRKEARKLLRDRSKKLSHWTIWNRKLQNYHSQFSLDLLHLAEKIYHAFIVEPDEALKLFHSIFYHALYTWRFGDCWTLLQAVPPESEVPPNIAQRIALARIALLQEDWQSKERLDLAKTLVKALLEKKLSPEIESRAIRLSALINIKLGDRTQGLSELKQAATIFDSIEDLELKAGTLRDLGDLYYSVGNLTNALQYHQDAIAVLRSITSDSPAQSESRLEAGGRIIGMPLSNSLRAVASLYARTGRTYLAIGPLEEMLVEGRRENNVRIQAEALSELGLVYRRIGRLQEAENAYRLAIPKFEELRSITGKAHVLCGLGMTLEQDGNIEEAQPYFQQSLRLFEEIGDIYGAAKIWHCLARFHHSAHNYELAEELYTRSLRLYREMKHIANTGAVLVDLAKLKMDTRQENLEALELCKEAMDIFEGLDDQTAIANTFTNMGILYYLDGQSDMALTYWQNAQKIFRELVSQDAKSTNLANSELPGLELLTLENMWAKWLQMYDPNYLVKTLKKLDKASSMLKTAKKDVS